MRGNMDNNAEDRATYMQIALDTFSDADAASNQAILEQTWEVIQDTIRGEVGLKLATSIAAAIQLKHKKEYKDNNPRA